ncbi:MAG: hypothetical protein LIP12_15505 [Clostridiales bacterium]|nr:hypothetical protein [Clostridiales bacterium]
MKKVRKLLLPLLMAMLVSVLFGSAATAASSGTVAKIGSKKYTSLDAAFKAAKNGETIVLQKNVTYSSILSVSRSGKSITLNLNGYTVTFKKNTYLYVKKGTVTIKNGTIKQKSAVAVDEGVPTGVVIRTAKNGTVKITGGTYTGELLNYGNMTISGGTFTNVKTAKLNGSYYLYSNLITNKGTMEIKKGTFDKKGVTDADVSGNYMSPLDLSKVVENDGTLKISGGSFTSNGGYFIANSGPSA